MLPKKNRVGKKEVDLIFKQSKFITSSTLTFKFIVNNNTDLPRVSVIAPKSVAKLAVTRNLLRRQGYIVLSRYIDQFPLGIIGVFVFKKYQDNVSIIENEIKDILKKIN
jgi:ribonuclease P protein component